MYRSIVKGEVTMEKATSCSQKITAVATEWPEGVLEIDEQIKATPNIAELWFKRGLMLADVRMMREAIQSFSEAIALDPTCGIYYRWRGHRHLNLGEIEEACADLMVASRLIPDNWDVWYHLGLVQVLLGNYELAELAYKKCWLAPTERASNKICNTNWMYIALMHQGKVEEAQKVLERIPDDQTCDDYNNVYLSMINFYKGHITEEEMLKIPEGLSKEEYEDMIFDLCTRLFGMANYYYTHDNRAKYDEMMNKLLDMGKDIAWNSFGYAGAYYTRTYRNM